MKRRKNYNGTFKANVVLELIRDNKSLPELAAKYDLHPNQIKNWKSILLKQAPYILADKRRSRRQDEEP